MDCASLPEHLLESELFGHEKGAFTGAVKSKPGLMETADRGTLFLDEIAELPMSLQVKLLRSLQERQVRRVGGTALIRCDVRIVSATNRDLRELVAKGQFREELFYRVNVIAIQLPPLRERAGDVPLLAQAFLKRYRQRDIRGFDEGAMAALERYPWPGNVRELQNIVERACALAEGDRITRADLPAYLLERDLARRGAARQTRPPRARSGGRLGAAADPPGGQAALAPGSRGRLSSRPSRSAGRQHLGRGQDRRHRPEDLSPAASPIRRPLAAPAPSSRRLGAGRAWIALWRPGHGRDQLDFVVGALLLNWGCARPRGRAIAIS